MEANSLAFRELYAVPHVLKLVTTQAPPLTSISVAS
jgi:hypothetical protein